MKYSLEKKYLRIFYNFYTIFFFFAAFDAQDLQVKSLKGEIASLRADLANYKENESKLEKDKERLEKVLEAALAKLFPEKYGENISDSVNMDFLTSYVQENCTM